jgi:hypothetical protein
VFLRQTGDHIGARTIATDVRDRLVADLGAHHPYAITAALNLTNDIFTLEGPRVALALDEALYHEFVEALGPNHPDSLSAAVNLSLSLQAVGKSVAAKRLLTTATTGLAGIFGEQGPRVILALGGKRGNLYIEPPVL